MNAQTNITDNNLFNIAPFLRYKDATFKPLVHNLITHPSSTLIHAGSGQMKSLLTLYLVSCIATGRQVFNQLEVEQKNVFYIDCEMSDASIASRARLMNLMDISGHQLSYFSSAAIEDFDLNEKTQQNDLIKFLKANNFEVLVIDNVRSGFNLEDENKSEPWKVVNRYLTRLSTNGISTFLLHHNNKQDGFAGSRAAENAVENVISISPTTIDDNLKLIQVSKERDSYGLRKFLMNEEVQFDDDEGVFHCNQIIVSPIKEKVREVESRLIAGEFKFIKEVGQALIDAGVFSNRSDNKSSTAICKAFASYAVNADQLKCTETLSQWLKQVPDSVRFAH